jgi:cytochrome c oxidase subunit 2
VVFEVTYGDINHGFGVYVMNGRLIAQTQAMPDYINPLIHVFSKPNRGIQDSEP